MEVAELIGISQAQVSRLEKKCSPHHARIFERMMQEHVTHGSEYFTA